MTSKTEAKLLMQDASITWREINDTTGLGKKTIKRVLNPKKFRRVAYGDVMDVRNEVEYLLGQDVDWTDYDDCYE